MQYQQYTFEDWYQGNVYLYQARIFDNQDATIVDWNSFSNEERTKIQECQKTIFEKSVKNTSELYIKGFHENFKRTKSKIDLLNNHLKRFLEVINDRLVCDSDYCHSSDLELRYEFWYYQEMRSYVQLFFIGGNEYDFSNVHSPNSKFWDNDKIMPEVLVEAIGSLIRLLQSEKNKIISRYAHSINPPLDIVNGSIDSEGSTKSNSYPDIFSSPEAYDFFCELESLLVRKEEYVAGYSFIFHKMKNSELQFPIKKNVRQCDFCDFLFNHRGQELIYPPKLPFRNPKSKTLVFETCKKKFLANRQDKKNTL